MKKKLLKMSLFIKIAILVSIFCCLSVQQNTYAATTDDNVTINDGWQYHFGDSPVDAKGVPLWIKSEESNQGWIPINDVQSGVSNPKNEAYIWFKVELPKGNWLNPSIYVDSILAKSLYMYVDGQEIFEKERTYETYQNILLIPLKKDDLGKILYIRISTIDHQTVVGPKPQVIVGEHSALINMPIKNGFIDMILGCAFIIASLVMIFCAIFFEGKEKKNWVNLSLIIFFIGLMLASFHSNIAFVYPQIEEATDYIFGISLFSTFVLLTSYFEKMFGAGYKNFIHKLWKIQCIYSLFALALLFLNKLVDYKLQSITLLIANTIMSIFLFLVFLYLAVTAIYYAIKGNVEAKIFSLGFSLFTIAVVIDIVMEIVTKQSLYIVWKWGVVAFVISLLSIMGRQFTQNHYKVIAYSKELEIKNDKLDSLWKEVTQSRDEIANWNKELEKTVKQRTASITNLLDNAGQGFLCFSKDLMVKPEYSSVCVSIFKQKITGSIIQELLFSQNEKQRIFLENTFALIFNEKDRFRRDIFLSLLPKEFLVGDTFIKADYKLIENSNSNENFNIMMILTDITSTKIMESQMEKERNILKMVVNVVVNYNIFMECVSDYKKLYKDGKKDIIKSSKNFVSGFLEFFRHIHTHKGNFAQFGMVNIVNNLHNLESQLTNLSNEKEASLEQLNILIKENELQQWLDEDFKILKEVLGADFFSRKDTFVIDSSKLLEIENKIIDILSPEECRILLPYIRRLRHKSIKDQLKIYSEYVNKLAVGLNKAVKPLCIEGENIHIDTDKHKDFIKSLTHVFRNMVDHGVETIEERVEKGKEPEGIIKCRVYEEDQYDVIAISDDGAGISLEILRDKILEKGLAEKAEIAELNDEELMLFVFKEGFSTSEKVTEVSGRGIGLFAVKHELEKLKGFTKIISEVGKGTEFKFFLPKEFNVDL